jgi:hypothetical protein
MINKKYYGNYRALVLSNEDPRDCGRVQVFVPGVYPDKMLDPKFDKSKIPWAICAPALAQSGGENGGRLMPTGDAAGKKVDKKNPDDISKGYSSTGTGGNFVVPDKGNHVWVFFDQGNHMYPHYFAMAPGDRDWLQNKLTLKSRIRHTVNIIEKFIKDKFEVNNVVQEGGINKDKKSEKDITGQKRTTFKSNWADKAKIGVKHEQTLSNIPYVEDAEDERPPMSQNSRSKKPTAKSPHNYDPDGYNDEPMDTKRDINRYLTAQLSVDGPAIVIDNRPDNEKYYKMHKGYLESIDSDGNRRLFGGIDDKGAAKEGFKNEEAYAGSYHIYTLGDNVIHADGNQKAQVNGEFAGHFGKGYGVYIKKGNYNIIIDGSDDKETGNLNIEIVNGHFEGSVNGGINLQVKGNVNLDVQRYNNAGGDVKINTAGSVNVKSADQMVLESDASLNIRTPEVIISGELFVSGEIKSQTDISSASNMYAKDFFTSKTALNNYVGHTHDFRYIGAGQGASPQQGSTDPTKDKGHGQDIEQKESAEIKLASRDNFGKS